MPETLFHAVTVQQYQARHAHGRNGLQGALEHLRAGQGQHQRYRQLGGWRLIQRHAQFGLLSVQLQQLALAHQPADPADPQRAADLGAMHFAQMLQTPALQAYMAGIEKVGVFQEQQVHDCAAGGWSLGSLSSVGRLLTRRPKISPASNSSHMGMASKAWENTSGGVRNMPTTKQPTIT